eukprot:scaffold119_cov79-Skeletonema_dohrnii-CCMP3373.AAC.4
MLSISTPLPFIQGDLTTPTIWAEDHVCKSAANGQCKISSTKKSRQYLVVVTATDEAGNSGVGSCDTKVGSASSENENDPLFLIGEIELVGGGGVEVDDLETGFLIKETELVGGVDEEEGTTVETGILTGEIVDGVEEEEDLQLQTVAVGEGGQEAELIPQDEVAVGKGKGKAVGLFQ